jgi:hypothetical protein
VIDPLASQLLAGDFQSGDHLEADLERRSREDQDERAREARDGERIVFHRITKGAAA